jgi:hypothetical protein
MKIKTKYNRKFLFHIKNEEIMYTSTIFWFMGKKQNKDAN